MKLVSLNGGPTYKEYNANCKLLVHKISQSDQNMNESSFFISAMYCKYNLQQCILGSNFSRL